LLLNVSLKNMLVLVTRFLLRFFSMTGNGIRTWRFTVTALQNRKENFSSVWHIIKRFMLRDTYSLSFSIQKISYRKLCIYYTRLTEMLRCWCRLIDLGWFASGIGEIHQSHIFPAWNDADWHELKIRVQATVHLKKLDQNNIRTRFLEMGVLFNEIGLQNEV
jgi:hypothetical protein